MARSKHAIEMDFDKANRQAKELDDVASSLNKLSGTQLEDTLTQLGQNWTGDNASKYLAKGAELQGNIVKTADAIQEVADAIREIAEEIYEAEMEAWERAHNRD
jgi:WXG100 family type VII secretion target